MKTSLKKSLARINPAGKDIFRNKLAIRYFDYFRDDRYVDQAGIDEDGRVFIFWLNGNIDRYTRREFIREAKRFYLGDE